MPHPPAIQDLIRRHPLLCLIGNTPLAPVELFRKELPDISLLAKCEFLNPGGSVKDRSVLRMIAEAVVNGALPPEKTILDSSSGNAGIAYAMIGAILERRVELVVPGNASEERKKRIRAHGAQLVLTDPVAGYDEALREVRRRYAAAPEKYFFSDQYSNDANWRAHYDTTAEEILAQTGGKIDWFVAGVGTGGTITGVARRLKAYDKRIRVACVMPEEFPGIEGLKPLGSGHIMPEIFEESVVDEWIPVRIEDAYDLCTRLARLGFFVGQSSGAYLYGAWQIARRIRRGQIVTLFPDLGERYMSTKMWDE
ncbi:MAG TPA: cysteine synthase family protein [Methylomirabilota bacterium]|jgi:cysteine synthase B|nr:cysteine synthase family protein [Methylomirabilota bacterium]